MKGCNLIVITEGGVDFGFGHVTRCLAIASEFESLGFNIGFIVNGDRSIDAILAGKSFTIFNWNHEQRKLISHFIDGSIVLIDSISISDSLILKLEKLNIIIVFIDDERRRNILNRGFVLDWTVLSDEQDHFIHKKKNVTYLLGSSYTPLRKEFYLAKKNNIKQNLETILITFGGSDSMSLTPEVLKTLVDNFPEINKHVVIGPGFKNIENITKYKDKNTDLIFNVNAEKMARLMQNCDIAIASGGQTLYELAQVGTPAIVILIVENAKHDTVGWDKVGSVKNIGWYYDDNLLENLIATIKTLKNMSERESMQQKGQKYISANGAKVLVDSILGQL
jgi:spore coat polysaccharide biosynthesis predicted glycosyltransferase SpsG